MASPSVPDHKATLIDGKAIAQTIRSEIAEEVRQLSDKYAKVFYFILFYQYLFKSFWLNPYQFPFSIF
uniref:Methylenetetrahydrofolate dehydrogenase n=1 Tax=Rhizophora mucronata TaxID=61149 RepID=A0A2P2JXJ7_RHIMU